MRKIFNGLLAGCLAVGFQSACCGAVLCIGIEGQVSIEMACRTLAFPQQGCANSLALRSDILPDQGGNSGCGQCVDIPIPGIADGARLASSAPTLLPPAHYSPTLFSNDLSHDEYKAANCCAALSAIDHSIFLIRTTVLLI